MINPEGKSEPELVELKKVPYEGHKNTNSKHCQNIIIISLIFGLSAIIGLSFLIYNRFSKYYEAQILEKDKEIERIQEELNKLNEEQEAEKKKRKAESQENQNGKLTRLDKEFLYDKNFYVANNMHSQENLNKLSYLLIIHQHTLEKGFSHFDLRPFGQKKISKIIELLKKELKYKNHEEDFSFIIGINSLREYKKTYEEHKWTNTSEYKEVSEFLKDYKHIPEKKTGAYTVTNEELKKSYNIDYEKFIKSRHSTRNYKHEDLKLKDIEAAVDMAKYSPSACNRQYVKLHYYPKGKMKQNVIDYSLGKGGLYLEGVNTFIITFDVNGLGGAGERNQGYFNAGLFATNLVNAFHSLGIGTCFIQFANPVDQEEKLKQLNDIPSNERIAVILYAGYYDEKSIFAVSPRRDFEDIFTEHK